MSAGVVRYTQHRGWADGSGRMHVNYALASHQLHGVAASAVELHCGIYFAPQGSATGTDVHKNNHNVVI
jgi:hypothetical protein